ncbi:MAG: T9SS type A sorting domain-containing protein [Ignavibacteriaceae bacterium]|nr:T9SS type A sorting domain-containing protein [Ignavibacteriaceae bacterium]
MNIKILFTAVLILSQLASGQSNFFNFLGRVGSAGDSLAKAAVIDSFITYHRNTTGIPAIDGNYAIFVYRGSASTAAVAGDFTSWSSLMQMTKIAGTNFFYYFRTFEQDARLDYKIITNGNNWILDPLNPRTCAGGFGPNSELAMPGYVRPWEINYNASVPRGAVETKNLSSTNTGTSFQVRIYLPAEYTANPGKRYKTVYFHDGGDYLNLANTATVLDNAIDSNKIEPVIGVFVYPNNRNDEYAGAKRTQYRLFYVNELVPYIDANYRTVADKNARLVLGDSFGGNISGLITYYHSDVFANCGLHSAAFWPNDYEAYNLIVNSPKLNIRYFSIWGTYESLFTNMRNFRDSLISKGYELYWAEKHEGHSWGLWKANIMNMIAWFFPGSPVKTEDEISGLPAAFNVEQNYPNPFNPSTRIRFSLPEPAFTEIMLYNVSGEMMRVVQSGYLGAGNYSVDFDGTGLSSGIYLLNVRAGKKEKTIKMLLMK